MYKPLADSTLQRMKKTEIIELLRIAEHNAKVAQEYVDQQAKNLKDWAPVVHGLWMPIRESEMTGWDPAVAGRDPIGGYICSVCKEEAVYDCNDEFVLSKYCPNCGAKMDLGNYEGMQ